MSTEGTLGRDAGIKMAVEISKASRITTKGGLKIT
jgi:hypothetical protein